MIHVPAPDPFTVFGVAKSLDLDARALERRYLELSRECHPDLNRAANTADCVAVLQRSAEINDAWKVLRDPWQRAKALLEAKAPGVLDRNKKLDPMFLADALELAEEVAFARDDALAPLQSRLDQALEGDWQQLRADLDAGDLDAAARTLHASHYHRKALADLQAKS
ncbi:MAG: Fe-S protein assembly co-chaperone HscB [Planctomycetes bacterium]|nr:Fe-S protein assembly co-chaperone HscB [Planctomycetota bacterium]MCB9885088.1 Fe-S protein assembly co-chaperone HscB [Planctomycetota bacterium]